MMINVKTFVFNPFQVNTYLLFDETKACIIIDAGCYDTYEQQEITEFIQHNQLKPLKLYHTHCHIDHILGNPYLSEKYRIGTEIHKGGLYFIKTAVQSAAVFGLHLEKAPEPDGFIDEGDVISFGSSTMSILYTPGHAEGSICFCSEAREFVIAGDVIFNGGIGRTDLPTGNYELLIDSIKTKLFGLGDETLVYPGHGPTTTIGEERGNNIFLI